MRRLYAPLALAALVTLGACDTAGDNSVFLSDRDVEFVFRVDGSQLAAGQSKTLTSVATATLQGQLDGFSRDEIVAARVKAARLARVLPPGESLGSLLQQVQVGVASGAAQPVASAASLGTGNTQALQTTGTDVAAILKRETFGAQLTLVPAKAVTGLVEFKVTLTLAVEVEGL